MVFCNKSDVLEDDTYINVTILILVDGFLQFATISFATIFRNVTILILVDGFLQLSNEIQIASFKESQSLF